MDPVPLRPLGERRQALLLAALTARVDAWMVRWAVANSPARVRSIPWQAAFRDTPIAGTASGRAGVSIGDAEAEAFGAWLAQAPTAGGQGMPARLAAAAIADLRAQLVGVGWKALDWSEVPVERHWLVFGVNLDSGFELRLLVDRALVDRMVPVGKPAKRLLVSREQATAVARVPCTFVLDLGSVPVADVLGLARGDVLVGQAPLDALLECRVGDSKTPHSFRLFRQGRQFAALAHA